MHEQAMEVWGVRCRLVGARIGARPTPATGETRSVKGITPDRTAVCKTVIRGFKSHRRLPQTEPFSGLEQAFPGYDVGASSPLKTAQRSLKRVPTGPKLAQIKWGAGRPEGIPGYPGGWCIVRASG